MAGTAASSGQVLRRVGDAVLLTVTLTKNGLPLSGKGVYALLERRSDGLFYNWTLNTWQASPFSQALVENVNVAGVYELAFDHNAAEPAGPEDEYLGVFSAAPAAPAADKFYGVVEYVFRNLAAPGDVMAIDGTTIAAIRTAIWTHVVAGNTLGLTAEVTLDLLRKLANNRLELTDGDTDNWVLYDDDDATVLLKWNVRDKTGAAVGIPAGAPARRTRGA